MGRKKLDAFTKSYCETAIWATSDAEGQSFEYLNLSVDDIDADSLDDMIADCADFQEEMEEFIGGDDERAGHDFWLTRNGHGAGFWDGDWPEDAAKELTKASKAYGSCDLYTDGDKVYLTGATKKRKANSKR